MHPVSLKLACNSHVIFSASCIQKSCARIGIVIHCKGIGIRAWAVFDAAVSGIGTNANNLTGMNINSLQKLFVT